MTKTKNFQEFIFSLCDYWVDCGCLWSQPYDSPMGAGTFHPHTFLKGLGPEPWRAVYVQPCRRPVDGRYGKSPYRFQHYYQLQVLLKPSPSNIVDLFLNSLEHVGIRLRENDIGLVEDDWKGPTLGAWGLGWEVRANGQEITQFTYFQQLGGLDVEVVCGEITYGLERLYMYAHGIKSGLDIPFNENFTWGDIYTQNEYEFSFFNFKEASVFELLSFFSQCENQVARLCELDLVLPAYDFVLQASHAFNLLDARGAISAQERQRFIGRVRDCAKKCALKYKNSREKLGFPLQNRLDVDARSVLLPKRFLSGLLAQSQQPSTSAGEPALYTVDSSFGNKHDLAVVFELGVEEMPPSFQQQAQADLIQKIEAFLAQKKLDFSHDPLFLGQLDQIRFQVHASARRLSVQLTGVPQKEPCKNIEFYGPVERIGKNQDGSLTAAGKGFCIKNGIPPEAVQTKQRPDGLFLYFERQQAGADFVLALAEEFKRICYALSSPLKMRWLPTTISPSFVRPVRWVLALVEDSIIPLDLFGLTSSYKTYGQRILSPQAVSVAHASHYEGQLKDLGVIVCAKDRQELIRKKACEQASLAGGCLVLEEDLLDKCVGLYESPDVFFGAFDAAYLKLPKQLITTVLKEHMSYFAVCRDGKDDTLLPYYVGVGNYACQSKENMVVGTQGVVNGRLDDGAFYFESDLATPLDELRRGLQLQAFQANLGSLFDKTERLVQFSSFLSPITAALTDEPLRTILKTAACYSKADLKSGCVLEFPEAMQGVMGGVLCRRQNILGDSLLSEQVAVAIEQHYLPTGAQSDLPSSLCGMTLSLMDKLDSLCLMVSHGLEPKGNKDPLGMRRLAISIARILGLKQETCRLEYAIIDCVQACLQNLRQTSAESETNVFVEKPLLEEKIVSFLRDRVVAFLKDELDARVVEALSRQLVSWPLYKAVSFARVLDFRIKNSFSSLVETLNPYRRAKNLTANLVDFVDVDVNLFENATERALYEAILLKKQQVASWVELGCYDQLLSELEHFAAPIAAFFETTLVNTEDAGVKKNRLALLFQIKEIYDSVADFSILQV